MIKTLNTNLSLSQTKSDAVKDKKYFDSHKKLIELKVDASGLARVRCQSGVKGFDLDNDSDNTAIIFLTMGRSTMLLILGLVACLDLVWARPVWNYEILVTLPPPPLVPYLAPVLMKLFTDMF